MQEGLIHNSAFIIHHLTSHPLTDCGVLHARSHKTPAPAPTTSAKILTRRNRATTLRITPVGKYGLRSAIAEVSNTPKPTGVGITKPKTHARLKAVNSSGIWLGLTVVSAKKVTKKPVPRSPKNPNSPNNGTKG